MDDDRNSETPGQDESQPDQNRREFVSKAGKALYLAPTLALLGSVQAAAQECSELGGCPPPEPDAAPDPPI